jgi:hypothetical protein
MQFRQIPLGNLSDTIFPGLLIGFTWTQCKRLTCKHLDQFPSFHILAVSA